MIFKHTAQSNPLGAGRAASIPSEQERPWGPGTCSPGSLRKGCLISALCKWGARAPSHPHVCNKWWTSVTARTFPPRGTGVVTADVTPAVPIAFPHAKGHRTLQKPAPYLAKVELDPQRSKEHTYYLSIWDIRGLIYPEAAFFTNGMTSRKME